ncbi:hypothetical protein CRE_19197 [Caenorhabditis remanei]|uniref:Uncharacterized protein n=2 Tax=Caenorhabditis remanei TaxID=31234 RepID=E3MJD3_CAERE|nr:hypothetical protein CRE_19197 [Caenorhabditis remanei]
MSSDAEIENQIEAGIEDLEELPVRVPADREFERSLVFQNRIACVVFTFLSLVFALTAFGLVCNYFSTKWNQS